MMISRPDLLLLGTPGLQTKSMMPNPAWMPHRPFAGWLVAAMKPKAFVQLSLGAIASGPLVQRSADGEGLSMTAIDIQKSGVEDASVDLLHIDVTSTDENAARQALLSWLPKLSASAVILLYGTRDSAGDVRRIWHELSCRWPSFELPHDGGLGMLAIGDRQSEATAWLTHVRSDAEVEALQRHFSSLGEAAQALSAASIAAKALQHEREAMQKEIDALNIKVTEQNQAAADAQRAHDRLNAALADAEAREIAITASKFWKMTKPLRRVVEGLRLAAERIKGIRHISPYAVETPGIRRYGVARPAGGYGGWWILTLNGQSVPGWQDCVIISVRPNAQRLALKLHESPAFGRSRVIRIPDDVIDVMILCNATQDGLSFDTLDISLKRLSKTQAMMAILRGNPSHLKSAYAIWRNQGARSAIGTVFKPALPIPMDNYQSWVARYDCLESNEPELIRRHLAMLASKPSFSVVVPVYDTPLGALQEMLASVKAQICTNWELCIADDGSSSPLLRSYLEEQAAQDSRIKVVFREQNGNISACSNSALALASGDYVALLDHDDVLAPHALAMMVIAIDAHPTADIFYSDEDKLDAEGRRYDPYFKPDFNRELLYGQNFINHLSVFRTKAVRAVGGFRLGFEGSQDYDLVLRLVAATQGPIVHVPHVLYHWRLYTGAGTFSSMQSDRAAQAARRAIAEDLASRGQNATVEAGHHGYHRVRRSIENWPRVSVIIPTRDHSDILETCIDGLLEQTDYPNLDIIIADNDSATPETWAFFEKASARGVKIVPCPGDFNYSKINNDAVKMADGEFLLFLNNDISMIEPGWLKEMMSCMAEADVAAVGAKLLYPDGTLQHGGVTLGILGVAGHTHIGAPGNDPGYFGQLGLARDVSCATAACLLIRRSVFQQIGGFDEENLKVAFNDVDLCIRIRQLGYRIIWTPYASLFHHESKSRGADTSGLKLRRFQQEVGYMRACWADVLDADPFWNPNFSLQSNNREIAFPPRVRRPWQAKL